MLYVTHPLYYHIRIILYDSTFFSLLFWPELPFFWRTLLNISVMSFIFWTRLRVFFQIFVHLIFWWYINAGMLLKLTFNSLLSHILFELHDHIINISVLSIRFRSNLPERIQFPKVGGKP